MVLTFKEFIINHLGHEQRETDKLIEGLLGSTLMSKKLSFEEVLVTWSIKDALGKAYWTGAKDAFDAFKNGK